MKAHRKKIWAGIAIAAALIALVWGYFALKNAGHLQMLDSAEALRDWVASFGAWGPAVFFLVQFVQVIVAPIPGGVTALAGGLLFGFWKGFALSVAGMAGGSIVAFLLAKRFGRPLVKFFVGEAIMAKYIDAMGSRSLGLLFMMFLLPFFPDDALCFVAGLTGMPIGLFLVFVCIARPPGMVFSSLVGAGTFTIPIVGWVIIALASIAFLYLSWKYGDAISEKLLSRYAARDKKERE